MSEERIAALEADLAKERQMRREAEDAHRRVQLELVTARDEVQSVRSEIGAMMKMVVSLEIERDELRRGLDASTRTPSVPPPEEEVDQRLRRMRSLREVLALAANELSHLHAEEVALAARRSRVLGDTCALFARVAGETGQAPPPIPPPTSTALEARLSARPVVDISEVAELIESLRPPPPKDD